MKLATRTRVSAPTVEHLLERTLASENVEPESNSISLEAARAECRRNSEIIKQRERFLGVILDHLRNPLLHSSLTLDAILSGGCGRLESQQADILSELKSSNDSLLVMLDSLEDTFSFDSYKNTTSIDTEH